MKPGKKILISFIVALFFLILGIYLYGTYQNIDISGTNYKAEKITFCYLLINIKRAFYAGISSIYMRFLKLIKD